MHFYNIMVLRHRFSPFILTVVLFCILPFLLLQFVFISLWIRAKTIYQIITEIKILLCAQSKSQELHLFFEKLSILVLQIIYFVDKSPVGRNYNNIFFIYSISVKINAKIPTKITTHSTNEVFHCTVNFSGYYMLSLRQGRFICIAQFEHKATESALQGHRNYIKGHRKLHLGYIENKVEDIKTQNIKTSEVIGK